MRAVRLADEVLAHITGTLPPIVRVNPYAPEEHVYSIPDPAVGGRRLVVMHPLTAATIGAKDGDELHVVGGRVVVRAEPPEISLARLRRRVRDQAIAKLDRKIADLHAAGFYDRNIIAD